MAKKTKDDKPAAEGEEGAKKKKPPIMVIGLCVALAGVGYMLGGRSAGATPAAGTETRVVVDGNLVSGRTYHDNGQFIGKWIELLMEARSNAIVKTLEAAE